MKPVDHTDPTGAAVSELSVDQIAQVGGGAPKDSGWMAIEFTPQDFKMPKGSGKAR